MGFLDSRYLVYLGNNEKMHQCDMLEATAVRSQYDR